MLKLKIVSAVLVVAGAIGIVVSTQLSADDHGRKAVKNPVESVAEAKNVIETGEGFDRIPKDIWREMLTKMEYKVLWESGTERAFTGDLLNEKRSGTYVTAGCGIPVFHSKHKFESGTGWPSFWDAIDKDNIILKEDRSWGMRRIEVLSKCGEHLGHVFEDGPDPTGLRYCINSAALNFVPADEMPKQAEE